MFKVTQSCHGMPCIEVREPSEEVRQLIYRAVRANHIDDPAYILRTRASAFLQSDYRDWILVEFWLPDYQPFVDWLNSRIQGEEWCSYCGAMTDHRSGAHFPESVNRS